MYKNLLRKTKYTIFNIDYECFSSNWMSGILENPRDTPLFSRCV